MYLCTGSPLPSDIKKILHSLLNDTFEAAYEFIQDMQVSERRHLAKRGKA